MSYQKIALRIDDIGACAKHFEVYSDHSFRLGPIRVWYGNWLFLKYISPFKKWGPYRELSSEEWFEVFELLNQFRAKLTVGVTATWVDRSGQLIPFPKIFPEEAETLKDGLESGLLEIANHGLTHCVVGKHLPRLFSSNRQYHREFWGWLPREVHFDYLQQSQSILQDFFETEITTLIPPGNVFCQHTIDAAEANGIKRINCLAGNSHNSHVRIIGNESVVDFHDREIVLEGTKWLKRKLESLPEHTEFVFVKNL